MTYQVYVYLVCKIRLSYFRHAVLRRPTVFLALSAAGQARVSSKHYDARHIWIPAELCGASFEHSKLLSRLFQGVGFRLAEPSSCNEKTHIFQHFLIARSFLRYTTLTSPTFFSHSLLSAATKQQQQQHIVVTATDDASVSTCVGFGMCTNVCCHRHKDDQERRWIYFFKSSCSGPQAQNQ